jgi:hypothetical protein
MSNGTGDLVPAPKGTAMAILDANLDTAPGGDLYHIVGIQAVNPTVGSAIELGEDQRNTELFVAYDWIDGVNDRHRRLDRYRMDDGFTWENIYDVADVFAFDASYTPARATFGLTRSNPTTPTQAGISVLVVNQAEVLKSFPDFASPTSTGTDNLPAPVSPNPFPEILIVHQGRVVLFPLSLQGFGTGIVWAHNEMMYWLTVNDVSTIDTELGGLFYNVVFGYENPAGYDCGASLSANELFLLKRYGGALMIQGDLNQPRAVNLPNVMSPGFANSWGTQTPLGFAYCVDNGTVYAWSGGDTSENLAPMMEPNFWRPLTDLTLPADQSSPNERYRGATQLALYRDLLMVPNNWFMDLTNAPDPSSGGGGWWRLEDPTTAQGGYFPRYSFYSADWTGRWCYASPYGVEHDGGNQVVADEYDRKTGASTWVWTSAPLRESMERQMHVRSIVVVCQGHGTIDVTAIAMKDGGGVDTGSADQIVIDSDYPLAFRRDLKVVGNLVQIKLTASGEEDPGSGAILEAPIVNEYRVGSSERERIGTQAGLPA